MRSPSFLIRAQTLLGGAIALALTPRLGITDPPEFRAFLLPEMSAVEAGETVDIRC
jgi:hypothetical protein